MAQEELGVYHISADPTDYEVARTNFFTLVVHDLDGITSAEYSSSFGEATEADRFANAQDVIKLSVTSFDVPHFQLGVHEIRRGNSVVKYAGTPTWNAGSLVATDYVGIKTKDVLMAWQAKAYDVITDRGGRMKDYKHLATLYEYTPDYTEVRHWDLYGCWISNIQEDPFDITSDGDKKVTCEFQYDRAEMHTPTAQ